jgi:oligogalacturonide transport system substrate-binding protein
MRKLPLFIVMLIICNYSANNVYAKDVILRFAWWGNEERAKATTSAISLYQKKHPDVTIAGVIPKQAQYLRAQLKSELQEGKGPDIFQFDVQWEYDVSNNGRLVRDYILDISMYGVADTSTFDANFIQEWCVFDKKLLGLPTGINTSTLLVNKALVSKYKINKDIVWNWDNIIEVGSRVHKKDSSAYLLAASFNHLYNLLKSYALNMTGGEWITDDYVLSVDMTTLTQTFKYFQKLVDTGTIPSFAETMKYELAFHTYPGWTSSKVVMVECWTSLIDNYKKPKTEYLVMNPPFKMGSKNTGIVVRPSQMLCVNRNSKNRDEAVKFVNWFVNDEDAALILGVTRSIPASMKARKTLTDKNILKKDLANATMLSVINAGKPESSLIYPLEITDIMIEMLGKLEKKKITPDQAADEYVTKVQAELKIIRQLK